MELKIVQCEEPTLNCFCNKLKKEGIGNLTSLEDSKGRKKSIVVGKVVKVIRSSIDTKTIVVLAREVLPNYEYGQKFGAVIKNKLAVALIKFAPRIGDRLAFYEPLITVTENTSFFDIENVKKNPKYSVILGDKNVGIMWIARKQFNRPGEDLGLDHTKIPVVSLVPIDKSSTQKNGSNKPVCNNSQPGVTINHSKNTFGENNNLPSTSSSSVQPTRLAISPSTKPTYKYKSLADIKTSALGGNSERVHLFAVVHKISKELTKTSTGKFTTIYKIVDESLKKRHFYLHLFLTDDKLIKQIGIGDILRLHRVKMELFNDDVDGRIFSNNDIVVFKKNNIDNPLHSIKNLQLTEAEKKRVLDLIKWYPKFLVSLEPKSTLLADISEEGKYQIECQIFSQPVVEKDKVTLTVTDGSVLTGLYSCPSPPNHTVTDITVFNRINAYACLKVGTTVVFPEVEAVKYSDLHLVVNTMARFDVLDEQNEQVININRRISESKRKLDISDDTVETANTETNNCLANINCNNEVITDNSLHDKTSHSCVTKSCTKTSCSEYKQSRYSPCVNKSCVKPRTVEIDLTSTNDAKGIEKTAVRANGKRRALFCANNVDLSDATTEVSEIIETQNNDKTPPVKEPFGQDTTFIRDLLKIVRTKYCSPRKSTSQKSPGTSPSKEVNILSQPDCKTPIIDQANNEDTAMKQLPVVRLVKLSDEECKSATSDSQRWLRKRSSVHEDDTSTVVNMPIQHNVQDSTESSNKRVGVQPAVTVSELTSGNQKSLRKRSSVHEDDTSTVVNMAIQHKVLDNTESSSKRVRLDSMSIESNDHQEDLIERMNVEVIQENNGEKVKNWLLNRTEERLSNGNNESVDEIDGEMAKLILLGTDQDSLDVSKYLNSMKKRMRLFLVEVIPDPSVDELDLVSGYCHLGCLQITLFSHIHWQIIGDTAIPLCPNCILAEQEKELQLMFMMELHVFDTNGEHASIYVCREHAEIFMRCSVDEYVENEQLRKSRVHLLTDHCVKNTYSEKYTPMLDATITVIGKILFLVDTRLKLPSSP